jgi:hypothetical protein
LIVLLRIQTDMGRHDAEKHVLGGPQLGDRHRLPLQVADRPHPLGAEQLEATDRISRVDLDDGGPDE